MANFIYMIFLVKLSFIITMVGDLSMNFFYLCTAMCVAALSTAMLCARSRYTLLKEFDVTKVMYEHEVIRGGHPEIRVFATTENEIIISTHGCTDGSVLGIYRGNVSVDELVKQLISIKVLTSTQQVKVHCCYPAMVHSTITNNNITMLFPTIKTVTYGDQEGISGFGKMIFLKKVRLYV
jgi:hypothetical protein